MCDLNQIHTDTTSRRDGTSPKDCCIDISTSTIEDSVDLTAHYIGVLDRYYTSLYLVDFRGGCHDYRVLLHSNGLVVTLLAPSHWVVAQRMAIDSVDFQVTAHTNRLLNRASGKHKHGAQRLTPEAPLFRLLLSRSRREPSHESYVASHGKSVDEPSNNESMGGTSRPDDRGSDSKIGDVDPTPQDSKSLPQDQEQLTVPACVAGKLVQLATATTARGHLQLLLDGHADGRGFLAIVQPSRSAVKQLRERALTPSQYAEVLKQRAL